MAKAYLVIIFSLSTGVMGGGYLKEKPVPSTPQDGDSNTAAPSPQSPSGSGAPLPVPQTAPSYNGDISALLESALYPGLSTDYISRYYGPIASPLLLPDGHIADTAEVAAARAAQLAALQKARILGYGPTDDGSYDPFKYGDYFSNYNNLLLGTLKEQLGQFNPNSIPTYMNSISNRPYYGPMDANSGLPKGYVAEAVAAAAAKKAQLDALTKTRAESAINDNFLNFLKLRDYNYLNTNYYPSFTNGTGFSPLEALYRSYSNLQGPLNRPYFGPLATPTVLPSGYLADTPEVAAARASHLSTLLRAKALWEAKEASNAFNPSRYGGYAQYYNNYLNNFLNGSYVGPSGIYNDAFSASLQGAINRPYTGHLATPTGLLPSGYFTDTPATAAARAAHLSALARARAEAELWRTHHLYKRNN